MSKLWYCVKAESGMDVRVHADFWEQGYEALVAQMVQREPDAKGRSIPKLCARYAPYVWVAVDYSKNQSTRVLFDTLHVADVLCFTKREGEEVRRIPMSVPESVILGLRRDAAEEWDSATRRVRRKENPYLAGQIVTIPSLDFTGPIKEIRGSGVWVEINGWPWRLDPSQVTLAKPFAEPERLSA
jgi:hypothetical protein